jgi:lysyl-tRNA synthetase class 1
MRWAALCVDYEMYGKDLIDSVKISSQICRILGAAPPEGFSYELFLDEHGQKISKSKGNGLTVEEWLRYAPNESLALFMYSKPRVAKRLTFDVIPRAVDDYASFLERFQRESDPAQRLENPVWHVHNGQPPSQVPPISFAMLLNLASVCNSEDPALIWGFISSYVAGASPESEPMLDALVGHAVAYYRDFVKPAKAYRAPSEMERAALADLLRELEALPDEADGEAIQTQVYEVGKRHPFTDLRAWFQALYEILLGQSQGPRIGSFFALYGLDDSRALIRRALAGEDLSAA